MSMLATMSVSRRVLSSFMLALRQINVHTPVYNRNLIQISRGLSSPPKSSEEQVSETGSKGRDQQDGLGDKANDFDDDDDFKEGDNILDVQVPPGHEREMVEMWNKNAPHGPEWGGPRGYEPTKYGDWARNGRVSDF